MYIGVCDCVWLVCNVMDEKKLFVMKQVVCLVSVLVCVLVGCYFFGVVVLLCVVDYLVGVCRNFLILLSVFVLKQFDVFVMCSMFYYVVSVCRLMLMFFRIDMFFLKMLQWNSMKQWFIVVFVVCSVLMKLILLWLLVVRFFISSMCEFFLRWFLICVLWLKFFGFLCMYCIGIIIWFVIYVVNGMLVVLLFVIVLICLKLMLCVIVVFVIFISVWCMCGYEISLWQLIQMGFVQLDVKMNGFLVLKCIVCILSRILVVVFEID